MGGQISLEINKITRNNIINFYKINYKKRLLSKAKSLSALSILLMLNSSFSPLLAVPVNTSPELGIENNSEIRFNKLISEINFTRNIYGTGDVIIEGSQPVTLSGYNSYTGNTYVNSGGILRVFSGNTFGNPRDLTTLFTVDDAAQSNYYIDPIYIDGGTIQAGSHITIYRNLLLTADSFIDTNGKNVVLNCNISGNYTLTFSGGGNVVLANSFISGTNIVFTGGTQQLGEIPQSIIAPGYVALSILGYGTNEFQSEIPYYDLSFSDPIARVITDQNRNIFFSPYNDANLYRIDSITGRVTNVSSNGFNTMQHSMAIDKNNKYLYFLETVGERNQLMQFDLTAKTSHIIATSPATGDVLDVNIEAECTGVVCDSHGNVYISGSVIQKLIYDANTNRFIEAMTIVNKVSPNVGTYDNPSINNSSLEGEGHILGIDTDDVLYISVEGVNQYNTLKVVENPSQEGQYNVYPLPNPNNAPRFLSLHADNNKMKYLFNGVTDGTGVKYQLPQSSNYLSLSLERGLLNNANSMFADAFGNMVVGYENVLGFGNKPGLRYFFTPEYFNEHFDEIIGAYFQSNGEMVCDFSSDVTFTGSIVSGNGFLRQAGRNTTVTLLGANAFSDGVYIDEFARLQVGNGATHSSLNSSVNNEGTLIFQTTAANSVLHNSIISGMGSLVKKGAGLLVITQNNSYTGKTVLEEGLILLSSSLHLGANNSYVEMHDGTAMILMESMTFSHPLLVKGMTYIHTLGKDIVFNNDIEGLGTLTLIGGGTVEFKGHINFEKNLNIDYSEVTVVGKLPEFTPMPYYISTSSIFGIGQNSFTPNSLASTLSPMGSVLFIDIDKNNNYIFSVDTGNDNALVYRINATTQRVLKIFANSIPASAICIDRVNNLLYHQRDDLSLWTTDLDSLTHSKIASNFTRSGYEAGNANLGRCMGMAVDSATGTLFVSDTEHYQIKKFYPNGLFYNMSIVAGTGIQGIQMSSSPEDYDSATTLVKLMNPHGMALDGHGNLFVADKGNGILKFKQNPDENYPHQYSVSYHEEKTSIDWTAMTRDINGNIYALNSQTSQLVYIPLDDKISIPLTGSDTDNPSLQNVQSITLDDASNLIVGKTTGMIQKLLNRPAVSAELCVPGNTVQEEVDLYGYGYGYGQGDYYSAFVSDTDYLQTAINDTLKKIGSGILNITAPQTTHKGKTHLVEGELSVGHNQALGTGESRHNILEMEEGTTLSASANISRLAVPVVINNDRTSEVTINLRDHDLTLSSLANKHIGEKTTIAVLNTTDEETSRHTFKIDDSYNGNAADVIELNRNVKMDVESPAHVSGEVTLKEGAALQQTSQDMILPKLTVKK